MKVETLMVSGFEPALIGMRNPLNSWDRSDSLFHKDNVLLIGDADLKLAQKLILAGTEHCKFMRQIQVWANVDIPRYIWQELDTYHFGSKNSCSTMHKLHDKPFEVNDFYLGNHSDYYVTYIIEQIIGALNALREEYLKTKDYKCIIKMKRILPESYLQLRTWNTNYAELRNIYFQRRNHRLKEEWQDCICAWIETLPYAKELIMLEGNK